MENKQTAVEWLYEMLRDSSKEVFDGNIWEQAKQMEKEQIKMHNKYYPNSDEEWKQDKEQEDWYWEQLDNDFNEISDEEIEKAAKECVYEDLDISVGSFELGARWYREQLKKK